MDIPTLKQSRNTCGPTAMRMVLKYYGHDMPEKEILRQIGGLKDHGVRMVDLAKVAKKMGFETDCLSFNKTLAKGKAKIKKPSAKDIIQYLDQGIPVMIAVRDYILYNSRPSWTGHIIAITDYESGYFHYADPDDGAVHKIESDDLLFAWHNNVLGSSAYLLAIWPKSLFCGAKCEEMAIEDPVFTS